MNIYGANSIFICYPHLFFLFTLVFLPQQPVINLMNFWNCHEPTTTTTARVHHLEIN